MTQPTHPDSTEELRAALGAALERLRESQAMVDALHVELAETNQGVVALYAELDDNAARLRDATELKSRFLSYMSHEFRTPLGSILSIARMLADRMDGPLTDEQARQVRFIQTSAGELNELVNDLLDLAKVEAGRVTISPEWFEMVDLFSALRGMFKPILSSDRVALVFEEPEGVPAIYTDDKRLSQILRNFISNALKFTTDGSVRVSAHLVGEDRVMFAVADTGIGIAPQYLDAIFEDFVQVDAPIQRKLRGTGLGLSLSRKLARLLGGDVAVTSVLGEGSTFSVTIPARLTPGAPPYGLPPASVAT